MAERKAPAKTKTRKREKKSVPRGKAYVQSTFNNTLITLTDPNGNVLSWASAGQSGFKGSRKSTPYAAQIAAEGAARRAMEHGLRQVEVLVKGPGGGREAAVRALQSSGLMVLSIKDATPVPHNGCRPPKRRRVLAAGGTRMARYTGPVCRICRRYGEKLMLKGDKCVTKCTLDKRSAPPGMPQTRRRKLSDRALQLRE
jgi:small subunit ribosomal protein S11